MFKNKYDNDKEYYFLNRYRDNFKNIFRPIFFENILNNLGLRYNLEINKNIIFMYYINDYTFQLISLDGKIILEKIEELKNRHKILDMIKYTLQFLDISKN